MNCKSLWIKASAKSINVNVIYIEIKYDSDISLQILQKCDSWAITIVPFDQVY